MARPVKTPRLIATAQTQSEQVANQLSNAGRQVWFAGLGVAASLGEKSEGLFTTLVDKGRARKKREAPALGRLRRQATAKLEELGQQAEKLGNRVEKAVQQGTSVALHRFGVPSRDEIQTLIKRVEQLSSKVEKLADRSAAA